MNHRCTRIHEDCIGPDCENLIDYGRLRPAADREGDQHGADPETQTRDAEQGPKRMTNRPINTGTDEPSDGEPNHDRSLSAGSTAAIQH
jgi:hypothetical protein